MGLPLPDGSSITFILTQTLMSNNRSATSIVSMPTMIEVDTIHAAPLRVRKLSVGIKL